MSSGVVCNIVVSKNPPLFGWYIYNHGRREGLPCKDFLPEFSFSIFWLLGMVSFGYSLKRSITSVTWLTESFLLALCQLSSLWKGQQNLWRWWLYLMNFQKKFPRRVIINGGDIFIWKSPVFACLGASAWLQWGRSTENHLLSGSLISNPLLFP